MSEYIKRDMADYLIAAMAANTGLDSIRLFIRGGAPMMPQGHQFPFVEVLIGEENDGDEYSGGVYEQQYIGLITFNTQTAVGHVAGGDWIEVYGERTARIPSYDQIEELVQTAMIELQADEHKDLGGLSVTTARYTEAVKEFALTGPRTYGLEPDERTGNYANYGSIPFAVTTERRPL